MPARARRSHTIITQALQQGKGRKMEIRIDIDIALWLVEQLSMYEEEAGGMATMSESGQIARSEKGVLKV
jgi:hypothetical protein